MKNRLQLVDETGEPPFLGSYLKETGYIHYCVTDRTSEEIDEDAAWLGSVKKTEQHIMREAKNIIEAVTKKIDEKMNPESATDEKMNPESVLAKLSDVKPILVDIPKQDISDEAFGAMNNDERQLALWQEIAQLKKNNAEIITSLQNSQNQLVDNLESKINQLLEKSLRD